MRTAYRQLALSMILVGLSVPASKAVIAWVPPLASAGLRFALVAALLAPLVALRYGRAALPKSAGDWICVILLALVGMVLFNAFLLFGLQATSAVTASILTSTIPAMTALCAALFLRERIAPAGMAAILLAVLGIAALTLQPGGAAGPEDTLFGNALVFGAVVSEGLYGILARRLGGRVPPLALTFLANLFSAVLIAPAAFLTLDGFDPRTVPAGIWLLLAGTGIASGLVAVTLWMRGIAQVPANRAGLFTGLLPAASVLAAILFLGEAFTAAHGIGLAFVLAGIAVGTGAIRLPGKPTGSAPSA